MMTSILDTFPAFLQYWQTQRQSPLAEQIESWQSDYLLPWPELAEKQKADYAGQDVDWRLIARERIFPFLDERLSAMHEARTNLLSVLESTCSRAQAKLGMELNVLFVIHVGIGCGAGWATTFNGQPAVLFGLENLAELNWCNQDSLAGLVAHELGHLLHFEWRSQANQAEGDGAWWQLYEEGFAQRCETLVMGQDSWHMTCSQLGWRRWCAANLQALASGYMESAERHKPVRDYFGSWFEIQGWRQTGYYLGHEVLRFWERENSLQSLAVMPADAVDRKVQATLRTIAGWEKNAGKGWGSGIRDSG